MLQGSSVFGRDNSIVLSGKEAGRCNGVQAQSKSAGVNLNAVLTGAQAVGSSHPSDFLARSACGHYGECEKDDFYFALNQADFDGHDRVDEAIGRGVKAVVCERLLPISIPQLIRPRHTYCLRTGLPGSRRKSQSTHESDWRFGCGW